MNAIERLQRTYGYFVDKSQWTPLSELFSDDATLEIGGKGLFLGKRRVLEYMQTAFGRDGTKENSLANHMQFQSIPDISPDGLTGWIRSRAYVMSSGGWGLPLCENQYRKENGVWKISRLTGPLRMAMPIAPTALRSSSWTLRGMSEASEDARTRLAASAMARRSVSQLRRKLAIDGT